MDTPEARKKQMARLSKYCSTWGGALIEIPQGPFEALKEEEAFSEAPFTNGDLGIYWKAKMVFYTSRTPIHPVEVIHEMGHVFACKKAPADADEFPFLGWEYRLALKVGIEHATWFNVNRDYVVEEGGRALSDFSKAQQEPLVEKLIAEAKKRGLLQRNLPVPLR